MVEIRIEPWKEIVIHEVLEQKFEEWIKQIIFGARAGGGGIPTIMWANGIIFVHALFPDTETIVQEKMKGIIHYSSVTFAVKEKFEKEIVTDSGTVSLIDVSHNEIFGQLAEKLKPQSKFRTNNH